MSEHDNDDLDEFIEFELTRDCEELDECDDADVEYIETDDEIDGEQHFKQEEEDEEDPTKSSLLMVQEIQPQVEFLHDETLNEHDDDDDNNYEGEVHLDFIKQEHEHLSEDTNESAQQLQQLELLEQHMLHQHALQQQQALELEQQHNAIVIDGSTVMHDSIDESTIESVQELPQDVDVDYIVSELPENESSTNNAVGSNTTENKRGTTPPRKGPKRYMLFDDLVANIVDYDHEGTPIVEFAISTENDESLPIECGICPDVMHKSRLAKHLKNHLVPGEKRYKCIYCEETYKEHKYLAGHARRHMGIRPYVCEPCKLYFSTKQDLRVHNQRRHMARDHVCEYCGKTFPQNTQLKRHREATHEKKQRFQCDYCPKAYYKNFTLQEHVRHVHLGKRRVLVCPFCGFECYDAHKMARHRKAYHLNQTHFECTICHEEFTDINYFDAHKRSIQCRSNTRRKQEADAVEQQLQNSTNQQQMQLAQLSTESASASMAHQQQLQDFQREGGVLVQDGQNVMMLEPQQIVEFDGSQQQDIMEGQLVYEITIGN